jgi:hypothetical protein
VLVVSSVGKVSSRWRRLHKPTEIVVTKFGFSLNFFDILLARVLIAYLNNYGGEESSSSCSDR